jgi:hypothetical protein
VRFFEFATDNALDDATRILDCRRGLQDYTVRHRHSGGGAASGTEGGAGDVTGTWSGTATDTTGGAHPMTMVVTQTGADVTGTGTFDTKTTTITGNVSGTAWTGTLADGAAQFATYSYTVAGNAANGTGTAAKDGSSATIMLTR